MKTRTPLIAATAMIAALVLVAVTGSCGDDSTGSQSGDAAVIDATSVASAAEQISPLIPICTPGGSAPVPGAPAKPDWLTKVLDARLQRQLAGITMASLTGAQPPDQFGTCGGRMTYSDYSHSNGVTTGTLSFEDYCNLNDDTGLRETMDGDVTFVNTGTPTAFGPVTNKIEADSPNGIMVSTRTAAGAQESSQTFAFTDYLFTAGEPGEVPTASDPNRLQAAQLRITDHTTGKVYTESNLLITVFENASGNEQLTLTGRGRRSNGDYYDITTPTPFITDEFGNTVSGEFRFAGASGSVATMTLVPGSVLQATMAVNGQPVSAPACR
jgi:hypothetical protein